MTPEQQAVVDANETFYRALSDREQRDTLKKVAAQQSLSQTTTLGDLLAGKLGRKTE